MTSVSICQVQHEAKAINKLADKISCQLDSCHPHVCQMKRNSAILIASSKNSGAISMSFATSTSRASSARCRRQNVSTGRWRAN